MDATVATLDPDVVLWFLAPNPGSAAVRGAEHLARGRRKVRGMTAPAGPWTTAGPVTGWHEPPHGHLWSSVGVQQQPHVSMWRWFGRRGWGLIGDGSTWR